MCYEFTVCCVELKCCLCGRRRALRWPELHAFGPQRFKYLQKQLRNSHSCWFQGFKVVFITYSIIQNIKVVKCKVLHV